MSYNYFSLRLLDWKFLLNNCIDETVVCSSRESYRGLCQKRNYRRRGTLFNEPVCNSRSFARSRFPRNPSESLSSGASSSLQLHCPRLLLHLILVEGLSHFSRRARERVDAPSYLPFARSTARLGDGSCTQSCTRTMRRAPSSHNSQFTYSRAYTRRPDKLTQL